MSLPTSEKQDLVRQTLKVAKETEAIAVQKKPPAPPLTPFLSPEGPPTTTTPRPAVPAPAPRPVLEAARVRAEPLPPAGRQSPSPLPAILGALVGAKVGDVLGERLAGVAGSLLGFVSLGLLGAALGMGLERARPEGR